MLDNAYHVETLLLILTLKKKRKKLRIEVDGFHAYTLSKRWYFKQLYSVDIWDQPRSQGSLLLVPNQGLCLSRSRSEGMIT